MKHLLIVLLFFLISAGVFSQTIKTETMVILENQKNQDIIEVNELWKRYLTESCPDSLYDNPCWCPEDKSRYKSYDLIRSEGYMWLYSLGHGGGLSNLVLSTIPLDERCYDIRSMFYWENSNPPYVLAITHVLAEKGEDGRFYLTNWLDYYSKDWKKEKVKNITFHYQICQRDESKIRKAVDYLELFRDVFDVAIDSLDVYISIGWQETQRLKGFDYTMGDIAIADTGNLGGTTDMENNIIYSNSTKGEFYQHEMMRLLRRKYSDAHQLLWNGLSEYFSEDQIMRDVPIQEHFSNLDRFLMAHPEIDLRYLDSFDSGNLTEKNYLIGLVILQLIEERCGKAMIKESLQTIHTDDELHQFINNELGISEKEMDTVFRKNIHSFAEKGFPQHSLADYRPHPMQVLPSE